jgi:membrane protein implicated in regulation of membrane protease activity
MPKEYIWAAVSAVVIGVIGVLLLYLGGVAGVLPKAFGLFDMSNLGVRAVVIVILLVIAALLFVAYRNTAKNPSDDSGA